MNYTATYEIATTAPVNRKRDEGPTFGLGASIFGILIGDDASAAESIHALAQVETKKLRKKIKKERKESNKEARRRPCFG